ncbi:MAG: glycyl-radical enzyme activating protein [Clostridia bacterium]|nr:glycyl-radical enzyme activating protein [Clostridia bacterium]
MLKGCIADIERAATHDGPGLRTTVFFKGCPLSCVWCHNPECISFIPEIMEYPEKCIGCGKCDEGCFSGARVVCGKEMTSDEVLKEVLLDKDYYKTDGGVTFSGGEPLAQPEFLEEIIDKCKNSGINCAIETSMIYFNEDIFKKLDLIMCDLKIWDTEDHKQYTGVGNEQIKDNILKANRLDIPIIVRTPVIPEINQGIEEISKFLKPLKNVMQYELLPYHPLGEGKRRSLRLKETNFSIPNKEYVKELEKYVFIRK